MNEYKSRIVDNILKTELKGIGAVLIEGPKWCGKTTTAEQIASSILYMSNPEEIEQNLKQADLNPSILLNGDTPRLIDEWQIAPKLWDTVRYEVDHRKEIGQFILTGSSVPADFSQIIHTGTGRITRLLMRPMSLYESGDSNGSVSIEELFKTPKKIEGISKLTLEDVAYLTCRGGWPNTISLDKDIALRQANNYYKAVVETDISRVDGVNRSPEKAKALMRSYARNVGSQTSNETIKADIVGGNQDVIDVETVASYIEALKKIFVIEESPAWNPNLRSKAVIRTAKTRYFIDPSIAVASLGIGPGDLMYDLKTFGLIFESMCIRDLRVYAQAIDGEVYHYRDSNNLECDAVIHLRNGQYGLIEIKLGGDMLIAEGVKTLTKLASKIDTSKMKEPSFLMILTAKEKYAYRREDGIYIVPIGCLKN